MSTMKIGTSGWSYEHWAGDFYPEHLGSGKRLPYYATKLPTVEINSTFYRMPSEHAVTVWRDEVPEGFAFSAKGSRFITHFRKLEDTRDSVKNFMQRLELLGAKLEVVLWQLPPDMKADAKLLDHFLRTLPRSVRHAVEFRDESWLVPEVFDVLRKHNAAHVSVGSAVMPTEFTVTADFVYLRFHGTETYHGAYTKPSLEPWRDFLLKQAKAGRDGYGYFNNDAGGHAPKDAAKLIGLLGDSAYRLKAPVG